MSYDFQGMMAAAQPRRSPLAFVRRLIVIAFGVVQLILIARIASDLGYLPEAIPTALVVQWSDALAAPVAGIADSFLGGSGIGAGSGLNMTMVAALAAWSAVEGILWGILGRFI